MAYEGIIKLQQQMNLVTVKWRLAPVCVSLAVKPTLSTAEVMSVHELHLT